MQHPLPDFGTWPTLVWEQWKDTAETLHMWTQIVGKTRLVLTPMQNHWWNVPLYLTARGLWTSPLPVSQGRLLDIEFDFIAHKLVIRTSDGDLRSVELRPRSVADFYAEYLASLAALDIHIELDPMPVETVNPIRFDLDNTHGSYDPDAAHRFWRVLCIADTLFKRFSTNFYGKISPVHFFWGSFDLAVTRFSGTKAPARAGMDPVNAEAYSHEVISAGFWPGNGGYGKTAFYAYAAPVPEGLDRTALTGIGGFNQAMGEFLLDYDDLRAAPNPADTLLRFLDETYSAAADLAHWDRAALDRQDQIARAVRPTP